MSSKLHKLTTTVKYRLTLEFWKLDKYQRALHRFPLLRRRLRSSLDENPENNHAVILPVGEVISGSESIVLPYQYLLPLVEKAAGYCLLNRCPCRYAEGCTTAPHDFGCLYLGKAAAQLSPKIGRVTDAAGAEAHIRKGMELGLVPMIVHASFDADMLNLPYDKMLAVCFCCDCCCTVRHHLRLGPSTFDKTIQRLPGLYVAITAACDGCGECHEVCPAAAIYFAPDGRSTISLADCKGCGLCREVCPRDAVLMVMDEDMDVLAALESRIQARTNVGI